MRFLAGFIAGLAAAWAALAIWRSIPPCPDFDADPWDGGRPVDSMTQIWPPPPVYDPDVNMRV